MLKFYLCETCKNIITKIVDSKVPVVCTRKVQISEEINSVMSECDIQFIALETKQGYQKNKLKARDEPSQEVVLTAGDEALAVYEYCNIHGLCVKEIWVCFEK